MTQIRPVSDLRNKFSEIETIVNNGQAVYLTKNGYGTMVIMSLRQYDMLTSDTEKKLDEADRFAEMTDQRYTHGEVFSRVRSHLHGEEEI